MKTLIQLAWNLILFELVRLNQSHPGAVLRRLISRMSESSIRRLLREQSASAFVHSLLASAR
jgi:hypothetical protein